MTTTKNHDAGPAVLGGAPATGSLLVVDPSRPADPAAVDGTVAVAGFDLAVCVAAVFLLIGEQVPPAVASTTWIAVPLVLAGAGLAHARWSRGWETGVRAALVLAALPLLVGVVVSGVRAVAAVGDSWSPGWTADVGLRLAADSGLSPGRAFALWLGAAAVACVAAWWPQPSSSRPQRVSLLAAAEAVALHRRLVAHGAALRLNDAGRALGQIRAFNNRTFDVTKTVPTVVMRNEDYGRVSRILADGRANAATFEKVCREAGFRYCRF